MSANINDLEAQWQLNAARLIFLERNSAVLPIQTCYRRHKTSLKVLAIHAKQPYNNSHLADVPLAPFRSNVKFCIAKSIRDSRRVIWFSATKIAAIWRCSCQRRIFWQRIQRVRTIQSFGRMTPAKLKYRKMRGMAIRLQAWWRAIYNRQLFLQLKSIVLLIQRTVRRYFCLLQKDSILEANWRALEREHLATRVLQNAARQFLSRRRVQARRTRIMLRNKAALFLQRNWYRHNGFFHTFLLMSCYRELERENGEFDKLVDALERMYSARKIQWRYVQHREWRRCRAAIEIQRRFRGWQGYRFTCELRRRAYAARRMHHWGRARIQHRHRMARRIQRVWWHFTFGRMLRHLEYKARCMDAEERRERARRRYEAATRLQAAVRRRQMQRQYFLHRCAIRIQRTYRAYRRRAELRRLRSSQTLLLSMQFTDAVIAAGVALVLAKDMAAKSLLVTAGQALVRGWLVRKVFLNARKKRERFLRAVQTVQRFWRRDQERMKRDIFKEIASTAQSDSPFKACTSFPALLRLANAETRKYLSIVDPRAGMSIPSLLSRLFLEEYTDMFAKTKYQQVTDLRRLTLKDMVDLYEAWQARLEKESIARGTNIPKGAKKPPVPVDVFEVILRAVNPRLYPCAPDQRAAVVAVAPLIEVRSYGDCIRLLKSEFLQKFGASLVSKAENMATAVMAEYYRAFSNYMSFGDVLTEGGVLRAMAVTTKSNEIKARLLSRISSVYASAEDIKRHKLRSKRCLLVLQQAMQQALMLLDAGLLSNIVYKAATSAYRYSRRFSYLYSSMKLKVDLNIAAETASKKIRKTSKALSSNSPVTSRRSVSGSIGANSKASLSIASTDSTKGNELRGEGIRIGLSIMNEPPAESAALLKIEDAVNKYFNGAQDYKEIELSLCLSRLYLSALELLYIADAGLRIIQCRFRYRVYKDLVRRARLQLFLNSEKLAYIHSRQKNYVRNKWELFRRAEVIAVSMQQILQEKLTRRYSIQIKLLYIPRFNWSNYLDEQGNVYWVKNDTLESTYETPVYTLVEWKASERIQKRCRLFLMSLQLRKIRIQQEEMRRVEVEKKRASVFTTNQITVKLEFDPDAGVASSLSTPLKMPRRLDFDAEFVVKPRLWLLLKGIDTETYDVVFVLRVKTSKGIPVVCDVRTVQDEKLTDVSAKRIYKLHLDIGSIVEARYKGLVAFYRGRITSLRRSKTGMEHFNILYDDGEFERDVPLIFVRIPQSEVTAIMKERQKHLLMEVQRSRRMEHLTAVKRARGEQETLLQTNIQFTQKAIRYGWQIAKENGTIVYINYKEKLKSLRSKEYTPHESAVVIKIQCLARVHLARLRLKALMAKFTVDYVTRTAIEDAKKIAFVGYKLEGVTTMQTLRRAGHWAIADAIETFLKEKPSQFGALTIKTLYTLLPSKFASIGVVGEDLERSLKKFQEWWKKTNPEKRGEKLALLNYFRSPQDTRSLEECIQDSEETLMKMFLKSYPNNNTRVKSAVKTLLTSTFPLSFQQVDYFLKVYAGKPSVAQEKAKELVDVPTLHSEEEEMAVARVFLFACKRVCTILKSFKIKSLLLALGKVVDATERVLESSMPRKAAKAAWVLRRDGLQYILNALQQVVLLQKRARLFAKRSVYLKLLQKRILSAQKLQRCARVMFARSLCRIHRLQQRSIYEQLWDDVNKCVYFYNNTTGASSYEVPKELFRPLVRDFYSDALIQAWPQLENQSKYLVTDVATDSYLCGICRLRKSIRVCLDCSSVSKYGEVLYTSYCFPCFSSAHSNGKENHNFKEADVRDEAEFLKCVECDQPATRKCLGFLSEKRLHTICEELKRSPAAGWEGILREAQILDENKLRLVMQTVLAGGTTLLSGQYSQLKTLLERLKAECDECYCLDCYKDIHSGGKRVAHVWVGFKEYAPACPVCVRCPAQMRCFECDEGFCSSCFKVLHGMGKKRRHKYMLITEDNPFMTAMCPSCVRRVGTTPCRRGCGFIGCDSCCECTHSEECPLLHDDKESTAVCVVCGEPADTKCVNCGDLYCSRKWMGNPGCFAKNHNKGNRVNHKSKSIVF